MKNLQSLIEELRGLVQEEPTPDLATLTAWTKQVLAEEGVPVGTKHKWADGKTYVKQRDGSWSPDPVGKKMLALPATTLKALPATTTKAAPAAGAAGSAPAGGERATPTKLPDDPFRYFKKTPDAKLIPVSALATIRARPEGIANAAKHMANAFNNEGEKRKPISLKDNGDGTYTVMDGNSTTAMARQFNWKNIVATVEPADGKGAEKPAAKATQSDAELGASIKGLADLVQAGGLKPDVSVEQHVAIAKKVHAAHSKALDSSLSKLKGFMPKGCEIGGRTKQLDSALAKLVRKPKKYKTVEALQDMTGMRVIAQDAAELDAAVASLKKNYKIIESDDYVSQPLEGSKGLGYRSFHAIIEEDGLQKEVQLRTPNQHKHAEWCHDIYKPQTDGQRRVMSEPSTERVVSEYAREMGDYFHKIDKKEDPGDPAPCPPPVRQHFFCL